LPSSQPSKARKNAPAVAPTSEAPDSLSKNQDPVNSPDIGIKGWFRWIWRQLTSMRTALILLLLLAAAAIPGSVFPQRSADPNGVTSYFDANPVLAPILDKLQLFDVYTSAWFSAIYILLFASLIGCVLPRTSAHARALRMPPVATPRNLRRMPAFKSVALTSSKKSQDELLGKAETLLKKQGFRVAREGDSATGSVSAERGYLRETGNLVFHLSLIGVLISVGIGGGLSYSGQRVLVEGESFVNNLAGYDSFSPGTFFNESQLVPFSVQLDKFEVDFYRDLTLKNKANAGTPTDFRAYVTTTLGATGKKSHGRIRVNEPLAMPNANLYLTGNGYAPSITIRDAKGIVVYSGSTAFLPQDPNYTSLGVIKVTDVPKQYGIISFFYPTVGTLGSGALTSLYPDAALPLLSMNIYEGDLGINGGQPKNVFALDIKNMKQIAGGKSGVKGLRLQLGETVKLPKNLGTVTFDGLHRFASLDVDYNPGGVWVLAFALLALAGVTTSLLVPRRRVWVRKTESGFEVAALARGDDLALDKVVSDIAAELAPKKKARAKTASTTAEKTLKSKKETNE
jgi:cytochrome c biogenesis protein